MSDRRPNSSEYDVLYTRYVDLVPETDIVRALTQQRVETRVLLRQIPTIALNMRYAPGKWTLREVVGHVLDTERLFGFRLFCFLHVERQHRSHATDENIYTQAAEFSRYSLRALESELDIVRRSHISLIRHLPNEAWDRRGIVSGLSLTVRALGYIMLGHERHHWKVLRERYLHESAVADITTIKGSVAG